MVHPGTLIGSLVGAAAVLAWRIRETQRPVTAVKLLAPPLGMSTGFFMFLAPQTRVPWAWALLALAAGAVFFSYPLVATSHLTRRDDVIMLRRSRVFLWILLGLVVARLALRSWVELYVSTTQTAALFFLLAFGMLLPWRITMFVRYRRLVEG